MIANVNRNEKKKKLPFTPEDFMPSYRPRKEPEYPTPEALLERWEKQIVPILNGSIDG